MNIEEKVQLLEAVAPLTVVDTDGWLCKQPGTMIKQGATIVAYFMYYPSRETAIHKYFDYVTQPSTTIINTKTFDEYLFDGTQFVKVEPYRPADKVSNPGFMKFLMD